MVQKVVLHLKDELDGGPTSETVTFGWVAGVGLRQAIPHQEALLTSTPPWYQYPAQV